MDSMAARWSYRTSLHYSDLLERLPRPTTTRRVTTGNGVKKIYQHESQDHGNRILRYTACYDGSN
jgi:hypothetical protein